MDKIEMMPRSYYQIMKWALCTLSVLGFSTGIYAQQLTVGIISDFENSTEVQVVVNRMLNEMDQTTGSSRKVELGTAVYAVSDMQSAREAYARLSNESDVILAIGSLSAKGISEEESLQTPVFALGIIDPVLQKLPYKSGISAKDNFSYIWQTRNLDEEINAFGQLTNFSHLVVFVGEKDQPTVDQEAAKRYSDSLANQLQTKVTLIPVGDDIQQTINAIPATADAAYFTVLPGHPISEIKSLIDHVNQENIPSFSGSSRLIEHGVLASLANENDLDQAIRKLAVMVDDMLSGTELSTMPVALNGKESFYLNIATAREIELPIPFSVLFSATIINSDQELKTYSFEEIANKAVEANLDISLSSWDVEQSRLDVKSVRSNLLPSLTSGVSATQINEERASAILNSPERSVTGDLTLNQLIYSEQAIAILKISKYLQKAQEYGLEAQILDVLLETYSLYINILAAKTNVQLQQENLLKTKKNKELAGVRVSLGASNNADLFRWEAELATANQSVIDAQTRLLAAKLQLNTLLANTLELEYDIADISLEDELFEDFSKDTFGALLNTPQSLQKASDFLVKESQKANPNKKSLLENINATNRQLQQNKRLFYTPSLALQAQTSQILYRGGEGSEQDPSMQALGFPEQQDNSWYVGVSLTYPIFSGFQRSVSVQQSKVSLEQLNTSRTQLDQSLELNVRASMLELLSASTNIEFSKTASESALKNFELVQENYKQGQVTITQVIDAQQAALEANLGAALSVYEYINTHLQLQYVIGSFILLEPEEVQEDFKTRLEQYLIKQNQ